eukprot:2374736-Prymnesium_polylepis.3
MTELIRRVTESRRREGLALEAWPRRKQGTRRLERRGYAAALGFLLRSPVKSPYGFTECTGKSRTAPSNRPDRTAACGCD